MMKTTIAKAAFPAMAFLLLLGSCADDEFDPGIDPDAGVTFVVSMPSTGDGSGIATRAAAPDGNGHFPDGLPADYRNYHEDADTAAYGTAFGGYPDAEAEAEAFERAVAAMAANYAQSPAKGAPAPATRAISEGSAEDNRIDELAILLFDPDTEEYLEMIGIGRPGEPAITEYPGDYRRKQFTLSRRPGRYKALFLANSRAEVEYFLGRLQAEPALGTLGGFRAGLVVPHTDTGSGPGTPTVFPMSSQVVDLRIPGTRDYVREPIELIRQVAKINVSTTLPVADFNIDQIVVRNFNRQGALIPSETWSKNGDVFDPSAANARPSAPHGSRVVYSASTQQIVNNACIDEIFAYEQSAGGDPLTDYQHAFTVLIRATFRITGKYGNSTDGTGWFRVNLLKTDPLDDQLKLANLLRNHRYDLVVTGVNSPGYATEDLAMENLPGGLEVEVTAWNDARNDMNDNNYNGKYQLTTDRSVVILGPDPGATATLKVYTDYTGGWQTELPSQVFFSDLGFTADSPHDTANGNRATVLTIGHPTGVNDGAVHRGYFFIRAGNLLKQILVIQLPKASAVTASSDAVTRYVGAFWKHDQRGERLIAIEPDQRWSAFVLDGADWVVMDTKPSTDPGVGTAAGPAMSGNDEGFDRAHAVGSTVGFAHGTTGSGGGYLRLGLRNAHAPTEAAPARYAVVLVVAGDALDMNTDVASSRLLYLRQGEDADYLFPDRVQARKISPYNLTAPAFRDGTVESTRSDVLLTVGGGVFADYPSQAGAMFRGVGDWALTAWNPNYSAPSGDDWPGGPNLIDDYDPETADACPPGYHRPSGGSMTDEVPASWWAATTGTTTDAGDTSNSVWGYYADGYFDRRPIEISKNGVAASTVNRDRLDVAYQGRVFFNSATGASLFMPAAGYKSSLGVATNIGGTGFYWTSTMHPTTTTDGAEWQFTSTSNKILPSWDKSDATTIRCVAGPRPGAGGGGTPPEFGAPAMENILAVNNLGQLNLDGQKYVGKPGTGITANYIVYFKYNSLIALRGIEENALFSYQNNVAWTPLEFNELSITSWDAIPYSTGAYSAVPDPARGFGDPCELAAKDNAVTGDWCVPTATEQWRDIVGAPIGTYTTSSIYYKVETVGAASPYPEYDIAHFPQTGQSLPIAGFYMGSGEMNYGSLDSGGLYMTNVNSAHHITLTTGEVFPTSLAAYAAFPIRCFPKSGAQARRSLTPPSSNINSGTVTGGTNSSAGR